MGAYSGLEYGAVAAVTNERARLVGGEGFGIDHAQVGVFLFGRKEVLNYVVAIGPNVTQRRVSVSDVTAESDGRK